MAVLLSGTTIGGNAAIHTGNLSTHGVLTTSGGTLTSDLVIGTAASDSLTQAFGSFAQLRFDNSHSDTNRGPNKIVMHDNGSTWIGGFGIHSDTVSYYSGGTHRWYRTTSQTASTQVMSIDASGNLVVPGTLSASGYNKSNWDTAFGWGNHAGLYLPLSGGTVTGSIVNSGSSTSFRNRIGIGDGNGTPYTNTGSPGVWLSYNGASTQFMGAESTTSWGVYINSDWRMRVSSGGVVTATSFTGSLSGNATTATTLQTARSINGTSFNGSGDITTANWGTTRTITIGATGKSVNGSGNVSWSLGEIQAEYEVPLNTLRNNLGSPTVREAALFHGQFNNKFRFIPPTLQEESTDGVNWVTSTRASAAQLGDMMIGEGQGTGINAIPSAAVGTYGAYRLTWDVVGQTGYIFLNALYIWNSTNGNTVNITIERFHNTNGWETVCGPLATSNWPGHAYIPHSPIYYSNNSTQNNKVRVTFTTTHNTNTNAFTLYAMEWFGGYPQGRRNVEYYDRDKNVYFPNAIQGSRLISTVGTGTAPLSVSSTTVVGNLNADMVDGYHSSSLWRVDGGSWNPGANILLNQTANNQEWSFDITRNGYTGGYWHVWDSANSTMLKVDAVTGKVSAPYNFVGNLEGNATTATTLASARTLTIGATGKTFNGSANVSWSLAEIGAQPAGSYAAASHTHVWTDITNRPTTVSFFTNDSGYITSSGEINRAFRGIIEDTRAAQRTPNAYDDYRTSWEFTNQITGISDWHTAMTLQGWHDGYAAWQIIGPASTTAHENWYLRSGINTSWNSLRTIIHSGNIGSQSVSYADESGYSASSGSVEWTNVQNKPATFAPSAHNHDDRYYTESESDSRFLNTSGDTSTGMQVFYTSLTNNDDWQNSPISIMERGQVGSAQSAAQYAPNLNFHWANRVSKSLWLDSSGVLRFGEYNASGVPQTDGTIAAATFSGALSGNATTATTLATARTLTIGNTGKTFNGSANVSWSLAEIGAQPAGSYLTAEADTLATVTGRGNTTTTSIGVSTNSPINLAVSGNIGTWLGGIQDATTGWSISNNGIGLKADNTTYSGIVMGPGNGPIYFGRTLSGVGTMSSWLEVNNSGVANFKLARPQHNGNNLALVSEIPTNLNQLTNGPGYTTNTGTVTSVAGAGGYGGLTLSGTVTTSGNITLGGTPTGTWPISVSGNAATASGSSTFSVTSQVAISGTNVVPINITGASHKYLTINPGNGYEAMVRYIGGSGSGWYVGKRMTSQLVDTASFHFYSEAAGATVGGITTGGDIHASGSMRAPIFYDSNNTDYYLDPSSSTSGNFAGVLRQNVGRYVRDSHYRTVSGYSDYYSSGNAGWYRVAEVALTGTCSGAVIYGTLYDHRYDGADAYQISVVARAECDFTSNNESHYINVGCTILGSTNYSNYQSKIRVVLVESSTNLRRYEIQFYETNWNHDTWQLESNGWTIYSSPQAPRAAVGTARVNYISKKSADLIYANTSVTSPSFIGALSGNATTATTLATARTLTIGNTGKTFNGSANVSWSLAEIGAQPAGSYAAASHTHDDRYYTESESDSRFWRNGVSNTWTAGTNILLPQTANDQEWSFDISRNGYTGGYWHVWDSAKSTLLKVDAVSGKVSAPYNFVGNLEGNADTAITLQTARTITIGNTGKTFNGSANVSWSLAEIGALGASAKAADSELLDGIDSPRFVFGESGQRKGTNLITNWNQTTHQDVAFLSSENGTTNAPTTDYTYGLQYSFHRSGAGYRTQLVTALYSDTSIYVRNSRDSDVWTSWKRLWHSGDFSSTNISNWNTAFGWGNHASAGYQSASTAITTSNIGSQSVNYAASAGTADNIDGWGFRNTGSNGSVNADTINSNGISYYTAGVTNFSGNATDGALYSQRYSDAWQHQIAGDYRSGQIALRGRNNGTWQAWRTVLDTTNAAFAASMNQNVRTTDGVTFSSVSATSYLSTTGFLYMANDMPVVFGSSSSIEGNTTSVTIRVGSGIRGVFNNTGGLYLTGDAGTNTGGLRLKNSSGTESPAMWVQTNNRIIISNANFAGVTIVTSTRINSSLGVNVDASATAGRIDAGNDIVAYSSSDERLKENITPIENALDKVKSLTGVEFDWKPEHKSAHGYEGHDTGIIAQQVQEVMPSAVRTNDTGFLAVRYEKLIGLLIEGMKEQQAQIEELKAKLDGLTE